MLFALFILIQSQEPPRLSKLVIAAAVLFFIVGISLLVYFLRRLKATEKEAEEDWSMSRSSLFIEKPPSSEQASVDVASVPPSEMGEVEPPVDISPQRSETRILASDPAFQELREIVETDIAAETQEQPPAVDHHAHEPETVREKRGTEMLSSPALETPAQVETPSQPGAPRETTPFGEDIWAELEKREQESSAPAQPVAPDRTTLLHSPSIEQPDEPQAGNLEPERSARVEHRTPREPFEPPTIKPLTPREQSDMVRGQQPAPPVTRNLYASSTRDEKAASDTNLYSQPPQREVRAEQHEPRGTRELTADPGLSSDASDRLKDTVTAAPINYGAPAGLDARDAWQATDSRARERRAPAGAILGLPVEASQGPMVLGEPVRSRDEIGIGGLTRYGKPLEKDGGRGGTIALLLVVLIIGGALAAYLLVPSVNSQVNAWVARVRGVDPNRTLLSGDPKVMVFASRVPEVNKNMVTAKGTVDNISSGSLEGLAIEVKLIRASGESPEMRTVPITPEQLEPNGHGVYEFEYDGNRETGFIQYTITRVLSNGNELRYTSPGQK